MEECGSRVPTSEKYIFESMEITGEFPNVHSDFYYPATLRADMRPIANTDFIYTTSKSPKKTSVNIKTVTPQHSIVGFGIYGRADPPNHRIIVKKHFQDFSDDKK